jgi:hypothetical protein
MNLLDLYEQREPYQQNIDELEYRRISDLRDKMEYLMKAYRQATTDDAKNAIMTRYNQYKAEREGYAKVREQQVPGRQDTVAHGKPDPQGIGDVQDPRDKMAQLAQKAKKGPLANVGAGIKAFVKGEPEPMDEQQLNPRALGNANFARLVKANMDGNLPVGLEFIRPEENFKLDQRGLDLISDYYDGLEGDPAKNYFIYRVLPSGEETLKVLRQLGYTPALALKQQSLPGIPTQGELPLQEKKKSDDLEAGDVKVARELQKLRARYPATRSDIEAVAKAEIDSTERSQQQLAAIRGANEKQDALLKQLVDLDKQQGREIDGLETENNSLEQRLASIQAMNTGLQKAIGTMGSTRPTAKVTATKPATGYADLAQGGIIDTGPDVTPVGTGSQPETKPQSKPTADVVGSMVQQLRAKPAPQSMRGDAANQPIKAPEPQVAEGNIKQLDTLRRELEHYGAKRFGQIYGMTTDQINRIKNPNVAQDMPMSAPRFRDSQGRAQLEAQANQSTNDLADNYDDYEDEDQDLRLRSGDYVRDSQDGESGEIFRMSGDPEERRVRILDRDGKGWYIEPSRLTRVDSQDPDVQRYFGKQRQRDMDEMDKSQPSQERHGDRALGAKGTTATPVAARKVVKDLAMDLDQAFAKQKPVKKKGVAESAKPGEYYIHTVYFKDGTKKRVRVTSDEFDVADYYNKRGQAVDRVDYDFQLHLDMTEAEKEPTTRQELLNRVDKIQRMMTQERNPANLQILRKELEMLKQRYQHLREDNDSEAVERAILNRILVAHTDLLMKYGPEKVTQAIEEVAYNVGDVDEIGTSDVSAYVAQVRQILGADTQDKLNEKWSAKYKSSINCADPKGFSQKAHCAGRKK